MDRIDRCRLGCCSKDNRSFLTGAQLLTGAHKTQGSSFATGLEVSDKRKRVLIISTGSKNVDGILGGQSVSSRLPHTHFVVGGMMSQSISEGWASWQLDEKSTHPNLSQYMGSSGREKHSWRIQ